MIINKKYLVSLIQINDIINFKKDNETIWVKYPDGTLCERQCNQEINRLRGDEQRLRQIRESKVKREEIISEKESNLPNTKIYPKEIPELTKLGNEIIELDDVIEKVEKTITLLIEVKDKIACDVFNISTITESKPEVSTVKDGIEANKDAELQNSHRVIKNQSAKISQLQANLKIKNCPSREELFLIADRNRKINHKLNFSRIAKELGKDRKTAQTWCRRHGIE